MMKPTKDTIRAYYRLTKPGIIFGNSVAAAAGFFLASHRHINVALFVSMLIGLALIIASACVFNNYLDREIDQKMARTRQRALVTGRISHMNALAYASLLGSIGTLVLVNLTNVLATSIALFGMFAYVVIYGIAKRRTVLGTVVGSVSGAVPPVVGYVAAGNRMDLGALLLFIVLVFWQMPHFYAIALFRKKDYKAAGIPVLPVEKGEHATMVQIAIFVVGFYMAAMAFTFFGYSGVVYTIIMTIVSLWWFKLALQGFQATDTPKWARKLFGFSLTALLIFCIMISLQAWLP